MSMHNVNHRSKSKHALLPAGLVLAAPLLGACDGPGRASQSTATAQPLDTWVRFMGWTEGGARGFGMVPGAEVEVPFIEVVVALQPDAQARLLVQPYVVLERELVEPFLGDGRALDAHVGIPVLLRAVRTPPDESGLEVDDRLVVQWIEGDALVLNVAERERWDLQQQRVALIAWLPAVPREVYVEDLTVIVGGIGDTD